MNQVGSVKICITRCGRSHDTQISVQFGRPRVYVCSAGAGRTFMSKTLFILFGIHAHKKVKRALFTILQYTHSYTKTVDLHELFVSSRKGWEGRFFPEA